MDIYKDVIEELVLQGNKVDYIETKDFKEDPYNRRGYKNIRRLLLVKETRFNEFNKKRWEEILRNPKYQAIYDILFVIDGQSIHPVIFTILKKRNPNLKSFNYLYDTTTGVYQFNKYFHLFDKVYTFDLAESRKYRINHLPIYWVKPTSLGNGNAHYKLFGLGRYNKSRYDLFKYLNDVVGEIDGESYIKVQVVKTNLLKNKIKEYLSKCLGLSPVDVPTQFYKNKLATCDSFTPLEFRKLIYCSDTIIDTSAPHQDGLTARFMWALGAEKKIITSNPAVREYDFFTNSQIFVIEDIESVDKNALIQFVLKKYQMDSAIRNVIMKYQIPNWLNTIFEL